MFLPIATGDFQQLVTRSWVECLMDQQTNPLMYERKGIFSAIAYTGIFIQGYLLVFSL